MKVNVHGLVFVGFAAAILAGAAHAEGENIVTSKAYTDATYQAKSTALSVGNTGGVWTAADTTITDGATSVPTTAAIKSYVDDAISGVTSASGEAYELKSNKLDGTSGSTIGATTSGENGNDTTMYPSAAAVKEYVQDKLTGEQNGIITQTIENADTTHAPSGDAVYDALAGKQPKAPGTGANADKALVGFGDGTWTTLNGTDYVQVAKYNDGTKDVMRVAVDPSKIDNAGTGIYDLSSSNDSGADNLTTAWAVNQAISEAITDADLSGKQDNLGGTITVGGESVNTAGKVVVATATAGTVDYKEIDTTVTSNSSNLVTSDAVYDALHGNGTTDLGYERVENKVASIASGEENNTTKYTSNAAVTGYAQPKSTATSVGVSGGTWKPLSATGYVEINDTGSSVTVDIPASVINNSGTLASGLTDSTGTDLVTEYTLQRTLAAQPASNIPAQNGNVCTATTPCALVAAADGYHWITMATGTHEGGVCGDAGGGNCGGMGKQAQQPITPDSGL